MISGYKPLSIVLAAVLGAFLLNTGATASALRTGDVVSDSQLGVAFSALPDGWSLAAAGRYTPGTIALVTEVNGQPDVRLSVQPLRTADTSDQASAASAAAGKLISELNDSSRPSSAGFRPTITRSVIAVAGAEGLMLRGMPGPPNVQIVVVHAGAEYNVVTFDSGSLQPDQVQALAALHFIPRVGPFPSAYPPAPFTVPGRRRLQGPGSPLSAGRQELGRMNEPLSSGGEMYIAWGPQVVSQGCSQTPPSGALYTTCGGYFYNQGDHTGQDKYAIDWPFADLNKVWNQDGNSLSSTVKHAGWVEGSFYGYGIRVVVSNDNGIVSYYAHLSSVSVSVGEKIDSGYTVGRSGCTGNCSGYHTHIAWCTNPSFDTYGQPYNGTPVPQSPLYTFNVNHPVYNSLSAGELVYGY